MNHSPTNLIEIFLNSEKADGAILQNIFDHYQRVTMSVKAINENDQHFKTTDAEACFLDFQRTWVLGQALKSFLRTKAKKPSKILHMLEAGSGTGIMAIFAAILNPNIQIICLEINPLSCQKSQTFIQALKLSNRIKVFNLDATKLDAEQLPEAKDFDLIFSETLSGGLFFEPQLQITQHIKKFLKTNGFLIPQKIELFLHLEDPWQKEPLTQKIKYAEIDFLNYEKNTITADINLGILRSGSPNIVVITSELTLTENFKITTDPKFTNFLNKAIILIPKSQQKIFQINDIVNLQMQYQAGANTSSCQIILRKL